MLRVSARGKHAPQHASGSDVIKVKTTNAVPKTKILRTSGTHTDTPRLRYGHHLANHPLMSVSDSSLFLSPK